MDNPNAKKAKVDISYDGTEVYVSSDHKVGYGLFSGSRITRVGDVALSYSGNRIRRVGGFRVIYGWFGHVLRVVGQDDRVEVYVRSRAESPSPDDQAKRKRRR